MDNNLQITRSSSFFNINFKMPKFWLSRINLFVAKWELKSPIKGVVSTKNFRTTGLWFLAFAILTFFALRPEYQKVIFDSNLIIVYIIVGVLIWDILTYIFWRIKTMSHFNMVSKNISSYPNEFSYQDSANNTDNSVEQFQYSEAPIIPSLLLKIKNICEINGLGRCSIVDNMGIGMVLTFREPITIKVDENYYVQNVKKINFNALSDMGEATYSYSMKEIDSLDAPYLFNKILNDSEQVRIKLSYLEQSISCEDVRG